MLWLLLLLYLLREWRRRDDVVGAEHEILGCGAGSRVIHPRKLRRWRIARRMLQVLRVDVVLLLYLLLYLLLLVRRRWRLGHKVGNVGR